MEFKAKMINDKVDGQCDKKILSQKAVWEAKLQGRAKTVSHQEPKVRTLI